MEQFKRILSVCVWLCAVNTNKLIEKRTISSKRQNNWLVPHQSIFNCWLVKYERRSKCVNWCIIIEFIHVTSQWMHANTNLIHRRQNWIVNDFEMNVNQFVNSLEMRRREFSNSYDLSHDCWDSLTFQLKCWAIIKILIQIMNSKNSIKIPFRQRNCSLSVRILIGCNSCPDIAQLQHRHRSIEHLQVSTIHWRTVNTRTAFEVNWNFITKQKIAWYDQSLWWITLLWTPRTIDVREWKKWGEIRV